ncbi:hypothetical protein Taro_033172 [Colocasia esculenta]|uniref:Uncharacterized protein n=1 Tax=Colocasia esculenta TaxID=4460 RepID=A0A843VN52_COLES|nr:hypothetical protein [Colocasia esculenta]
MSPTTPSTSDRSEFSKSKENVTVTVRFRPLSTMTFVDRSAREINKGDEIAWYADGDYTVWNEYNASVAYSFGLYGWHAIRIVSLCYVVRSLYGMVQVQSPYGHYNTQLSWSSFTPEGNNNTLDTPPGPPSHPKGNSTLDPTSAKLRSKISDGLPELTELDFREPRSCYGGAETILTRLEVQVEQWRLKEEMEEQEFEREKKLGALDLQQVLLLESACSLPARMVLNLQQETLMALAPELRARMALTPKELLLTPHMALPFLLLM